MAEEKLAVTPRAEEAIKQISNNHNADEGSVHDKYVSLLKDETEKGVSDPERRALRRLGLSYKGGESNRTEALQGYVLGSTDAINTSESAVNRAKSFIEKRGWEQAVKHGMIKAAPSGGLPNELASITVTEGGDTKDFAVLDSNSNSPTAGEVLPAKDYIRYVYGAVWRAPEDGPHLFSGVLSADNHSEKPPAPTEGEPVSFEAVWVGESNQSNTVRLRFRDPSPFETTDQFGGPDVVDLLDSGLDARVSLEEADSSNFDRNDIAITYGSVTYMELAPDEGQSRRLAVVDPFAFDSDLSRTVWVPDHEEINFGEQSDVFIIGQVSKSNNEYPDSIEAVGIIPHPDYVVDLSGVQPMGDDAESEAGAAQDASQTDEEPAPEPEETDDATPPQDDTDAGFETGATIDDSEQASKAEDGEHLPDIIKDADYTKLQSVASGVDGVPGSGISAPEMQEQLLREIGVETLAARLAADDDEEERPDAEADAVAGSDAEAEETATTDGGESVVDDAASEPGDEDEDWSW